MGSTLLLIFLAFRQAPPKASLHPEWGPEPPVAPYGQEAMPSQPALIPLIFPVLAQCRMDNGYNEERGQFRHTGIDIRATKMSPVVAPISGILGLKPDSFWIYADDGWAVLGTHLNDDNLGKHDHAGGRDLMFAPNLVPGQFVHSGQFIGYNGESGDATAPHLHFEIYAPGPGTTMSRIRNAFPSLKAAQVISAPVVYPFGEAPPKGSILYQGCIRKLDPDHRRITVILVSRELPTGEAIAITQPRYFRFTLSPTASGPRWDDLSHLPDTTPITFALPANGKPDEAVVTKIEVAEK